MPKDRRADEDGKDLADFSDTSSSVSLDYEDERERKRERRRKKSKNSQRRGHDDHDENDDDYERKHRRHSSSRCDKKRKKKRHKKSSKSDRRKKDRKRRKDDDYGDSSSHDSESSSSDDSRRRRHSKRSKKERKRRRKDHSRDDDESDGKRRKKSRQVGDVEDAPKLDTRSHKTALALHNLFLDKPDFATELPLILIRLAGGATFDLRQVTDRSIAHGLETIFKSLETFGVKKQEGSGMWMFENPPGATRRDELVLVKVIRSLLDEVGLTMGDMAKFETEQSQRSEQEERKQSVTESSLQLVESKERTEMKELTWKLLEKFLSKDSTIGSQLAGLCKTIAEGESVSVDGIPDENLKAGLESLFQTCGLEKSEIEDDDDDDEEEDSEDSDEPPLMGYGLPDDNDAVQIKLATIMAACREGPPARKSIGPMRRPMTEEEEKAASAMYARKDEDEEAEDDGPLLPGEARNVRGPAMSLEMIQAQAEHRELQLKATAAGVAMPTQNGGREEWMIIPGQHDFLSGIKSGQAIKSRGFQNKKSRGGDKDSQLIHPAVQAEMDSIMKAHENARGASLMDLHRSKKTQEKELAAKNSDGKNEWKWSRDKDLDAGRRVDKDALGMILGGAASDLKSKFAGGFNR